LVWHAANDADVEPGLKVSNRNILRDRLERMLLSYGIRHADAIVAQTQDQGRLLWQNFGRRPDAVVANFHPDPTESIDKSGPPRVVWIANLKRAKQPDVFLRLANALRDIDEARFVIIGAGAIRTERSAWHESLMRDIARAPNVDYLGPLSQGDVNAELARAHVFVNTSLYEGFANTFIQAWMRKCAVVSLNVNPDRVLDGDSVGFFSGTEEHMASIVRRLITDSSLRNDVAMRAHLYAMEFHSMRNACLLEDLMFKVAAGSL
jgi:glycosyltransferase involved in cell wall biosynthesis